MKHIHTYATILAGAFALGVMPTAQAQTDTIEAGIPFAIIFDGTFYPAEIETLTYPHTAATLNKSGDCLLNVMTDLDDRVAAISIVKCSDVSFKDVTARFIRSQTFTGTLSASSKVHSLQVKWEIGEMSQTPQPQPIQIAAR